ncbi:MAG: hypothetical protein AABZ44_01510 [Elusimicrobiota bacterium]
MECLRCGIIYSKWQARQERALDPASTTENRIARTVEIGHSFTFKFNPKLIPIVVIIALTLASGYIANRFFSAYLDNASSALKAGRKAKAAITDAQHRPETAPADAHNSPDDDPARFTDAQSAITAAERLALEQAQRQIRQDNDD